MFAAELFGGPLEYLEPIVHLLELLSRSSLTAGYMGTDDTLTTILASRFPQLVSASDSA